MRSRLGRRVRFVLKAFVGALLALIVTGIVYEKVGERRDKVRFSQVGHSVDIGGRSLNIHCLGEGSPTVILEATVGYRWTPIQREVARFTRACWYDRAGYGWSDAGPSPRTSVAVANDLHALLTAASVPSPYVLVGASAAGFPVRVFAGQHLDDVAGVVLVDAAHEDQYRREPQASLGWANRLPGPLRAAVSALIPSAVHVGLIRFALRGSEASSARRPPPQGMTAHEARYLAFLSSLPRSFVAAADEARNWKVSADAARHAKTLGDRPLIVLTAGKYDTPFDAADLAEVRAFHELWVKELQPKLVGLSSRGRQILVENSGHGIQFEAPDVLIGAIKEIVSDSRAKATRASVPRSANPSATSR